MSVVTDVILTTRIGERAAVAWLNEQIAEELKLPPLLRVDELWMSGKAIQADIYIGAYNYLEHRRFHALVLEAPWHDRDSVKLFWQQEHYETGFRRVE